MLISRTTLVELADRINISLAISKQIEKEEYSLNFRFSEFSYAVMN
jgi:hypothetical protein